MLVACLGIAQAGLAADAAKPAASEDERLAAFFEEVFQRNVKDSPIFQAQLGMKGPDYGKWGDFSDAEAIRQNDLTKSDLDRLRADFRYDALSQAMKISYRIFELQQESALDNFPFRFHGYAFSTVNNPVTQFATFLQNLHRIDDVSDAEAYISRLNLSEAGIAAGHRGIRHGRRARHRADLVLLRSGARGRPLGDQGRAHSTTAARTRRCSRISAARWTSSRFPTKKRSAFSTPPSRR